MPQAEALPDSRTLPEYGPTRGAGGSGSQKVPTTAKRSRRMAHGMPCSSANHGFGWLKPSPTGKPCQAMVKFRDLGGRSSGFCGCAVPPRRDGRKPRRKTSRNFQAEQHVPRNYGSSTLARACHPLEAVTKPPPKSWSLMKQFHALTMAARKEKGGSEVFQHHHVALIGSLRVGEVVTVG
jgi:hypothetical protein